MFVNEIEQKNQSELINKLCLTWIAVNAFVMTAGIIIYPPASFSRWVFNILVVTSIALTSIILNYFTYPKIAAHVLPIGISYLFVLYRWRNSFARDLKFYTYCFDNWISIRSTKGGYNGYIMYHSDTFYGIYGNKGISSSC